MIWFPNFSFECNGLHNKKGSVVHQHSVSIFFQCLLVMTVKLFKFNVKNIFFKTWKI